MQQADGQYTIGTTIRDYRIEALIGRGGFAEVYSANQQMINRRVALKVILPHYANQSSFLDRFNREAQIIARMEHPHIVPLYEYWHDSRQGAFLAMRWLDSGTLKERIRTHSFSLRDFVTLIQQVGSALQMAHDNNIIHRDLKPENILFDRYGNAYLSDFGIAKDTQDNFTLEQGDNDSGVLGTPRYIAPEQIVNTGNAISARADIYSLGILMYEIITGKHPFEGTNTIDMLRKHIDAPLPNLITDDYDVSIRLSNILQQATAKSPSRRQGSVRQLVRELEEVLAATPREKAEAPLILSRKVEAKLIDKADTAKIGSVPSTNTTVALSRDMRMMGDVKATIFNKASQVFKRPRKLIGRDDLLQRVHSLMDDAEPLLIHGMGGLGKTSLVATVIAERITRDRKPVIWLNAGYLDGGQILDAIAVAFEDAKHIAGLQGDEKIIAMRDFLADNDMALVLDDVWKDQALFQVMKAIPHGVPVVVTSRNSAPIDGEIIEIGVLSDDSALALLAYHARAALDTNADARTLCQIVGNHTFALELAGKHLRMSGLEGLKALKEKIEAAPHKAEATGQFSDIGRHGIKDLLDESYAMLDHASQRTLTALGGVDALETTMPLLVEILQESQESIAKTLEVLEQRGLAAIKSGAAFDTVELHSLTYSYARELYKYSALRGEIPLAVQRLIQSHGEDFDLLEAEQRNILGAIQRRNTAVDIRLFVIKHLVLGGYLTMRGHTPTLVSALDSAIDDAVLREDLELLHHLRSKRGNIANDLGNWQKAVYSYRSALELAIELKEKPLPAEADEAAQKENERLRIEMRDREVILSCVLASAMLRNGDKDQDCDNYLDHAESLALALDDAFLQGYVLETRGFMAQYRGDMEGAAKHFERGVAVARQADDDQGLYYALLNLGTAQGELQQYDVAIQTLDQALKLVREHNHKPAIAEVLESMGRIHHHNAKPDQAGELLRESLDLFTQSGMEARAAVVKAFVEEHYLAS